MDRPHDFARTREAITTALDRHTASLAAVAILYRGRVVLDQHLGSAPLHGEGRPLHLWMSAGKAVTAVLVVQAWEEGLLELDDRVVEFVPEFAPGGKDRITLRHLLTHTSGIRLPSLPWPAAGWEGTVAAICASRLEPRWELGRTAGYHMASSWFILGEVLQRIHQLPFSELVRKRLFLPLGCDDCWIGEPPDLDRWLERVQPMWDSSVSPWQPLEATTANRLATANPGANGIGPISQLARVWELLRRGGELDGIRVLSPQGAEVLLARQRVGQVDRTFRVPLDWGLGVIPNSARRPEDAADLPYHYGPWASPRAVGHSGNRSSVAFCDPEHQLAVGLWWNALAAEGDHRARTNAVLGAVYEDLGLARTD
jgi:CubicO group peptidase (beta-lactamase class C family)